MHHIQNNVYLYFIEGKNQSPTITDKMKTIDEQRAEAIRVINNVITLKVNVKNGCFSDQDELNKQEPRLEQIKQWAKENDQIQEIKNYFASKNFGQHNQFAAAKMAEFFNA